MHHLVCLFQKPHFFHRDRRTSIAFDAAGTMTFLQITAEENLEEVERNEGVEYFEHKDGVLEDMMLESKHEVLERRLKQPTALLLICGQLLLQGFDGGKLLFFAKVMQQFDGDGLTIEIAVKIEQMHFDATLLTVVKGGTGTDIEHAEKGLRVENL